ncbi:MAG: ABC transporter substrate-binding protein [Deltaproteobacteria bacterium]|nr:ABC transporter substrate-binding protein [Deltaproteobacteria bacterium]
MIKKFMLMATMFCLLASLAVVGPAEAKTIKIGCLLTTTGDLGPMGTRMANAAKLAIDQINAQGGLLGKDVELILENDNCEPAKGLERIKKLIDVNGVKVIVGPMISGSSFSAGPYASRKRVPMITPSATAAKLSKQRWTKWFFRTCLRDDLQAKVLSDVIMEKGFTRLATFVLDNTYGQGLEIALVDLLKQAGWKGKHVASVRYDQTKKDYLTQLQQIKSSNPDVIFASTYCDDGIIVFRQALDLGLDKIPWLGCDGNYGSGLFKEAKSAEFMEKAFLAGTRSAGGLTKTYDTFAAAYKSKYGEAPEVYCDTTYDAVWAVAKAIKKAGKYDGKAIRDAMETLEFEGASGPIAFNDTCDRASGTFELWKVEKQSAAKYGYKNVRIKLVTIK